MQRTFTNYKSKPKWDVAENVNPRRISTTTKSNAFNKQNIWQLPIIFKKASIYKQKWFPLKKNLI